MEALQLANNMLKLPQRMAKRLKGKRIEITEVKDVIVLKTESNPIAEARGFLKGKRLTTRRYMEMKISEKELE